MDTSYASYMTPLMLAFMVNNHALAHLLLARGHTLELPHADACECDACDDVRHDEGGDDDAMRARRRLHAFWAMSRRVAVCVSYDGVRLQQRLSMARGRRPDRCGRRARRAVEEGGDRRA